MQAQKKVFSVMQEVSGVRRYRAALPAVGKQTLMNTFSR
jgi:hypothetical protein